MVTWLAIRVLERIFQLKIHVVSCLNVKLFKSHLLCKRVYVHLRGRWIILEIDLEQLLRLIDSVTGYDLHSVILVLERLIITGPFKSHQLGVEAQPLLLERLELGKGRVFVHGSEGQDVAFIIIHERT